MFAIFSSKAACVLLGFHDGSSLVESCLSIWAHRRNRMENVTPFGFWYFLSNLCITVVPSDCSLSCHPIVVFRRGHEDTNRAMEDTNNRAMRLLQAQYCTLNGNLHAKWWVTADWMS